MRVAFSFTNHSKKSYFALWRAVEHDEYGAWYGSNVRSKERYDIGHSDYHADECYIRHAQYQAAHETDSSDYEWINDFATDKATEYLVALL